MQDWAENWVEFERRGEIISLASECLYLIIKEKKNTQWMFTCIILRSWVLLLVI